MGDLNALVLAGFGLRASRVIREKAYYICDTPDGLRVIYKAQENGERILFQHALKEYLIGAGFPWVDRHCLTPAGEPFVCVGGDFYVMTHFIERREPDFNNWNDFARVTEAVARWHTCARQVPFQAGFTDSRSTPMTEIFNRQAEELALIRKRVSRQARLSDFDVLLIKHAGYYAQQIKEAAEGLAQTDYAAWHTQALAARHICHNALREESLPLSGETVYITQYAEACVDLQLSDLCALIRRYAQRVGGAAVPMPQVLEAYGKAEPIPQAAYAVLWALLKYPYQFMKIVTQYYSKKRTWTPNAITNRMLAVVNEKDNYARYIETLASL